MRLELHYIQNAMWLVPYCWEVLNGHFTGRWKLSNVLKKPVMLLVKCFRGNRVNIRSIQPSTLWGDEMFLTSDSICSFCSTEALIRSLENCFLNTDSHVLLSIPAGSEAECVLCGETKDFEKQIFCTSCGRHYHGSCLEPSVDLTPVVRMGWQCPDCKVCQGCRFVD